MLTEKRAIAKDGINSLLGGFSSGAAVSMLMPTPLSILEL
jgi:hypothetical protein